MTRTFILPYLTAFLARYPQLELQIGQGDRLVDLLREGIDWVIGTGELDDSGMILCRLVSSSARRLLNAGLNSQ